MSWNPRPTVFQLVFAVAGIVKAPLSSEPGHSIASKPCFNTINMRNEAHTALWEWSRFLFLMKKNKKVATWIHYVIQAIQTIQSFIQIVFTVLSRSNVTNSASWFISVKNTKLLHHGKALSVFTPASLWFLWSFFEAQYGFCFSQVNYLAVLHPCRIQSYCFVSQLTEMEVEWWRIKDRLYNDWQEALNTNKHSEP